MKEKKIYSLIIAYLTGFISALFFCVGFVVKHEHSLKLSPLFFLVLFLMTVFSGSLVYVFFLLSDKIFKTEKVKAFGFTKKNDVLIFFAVFLILILCWAPYFLALYPGIFAYDNQWQYFMYIDHDISNHQPVIHTLIFGLLVSGFENITGSINKGMAAYSVFQMLVMGLGSAYIPYKIYKRSESRVLFIFSIAFLALYPVFVIFVFTGTKDSIFSLALADFMILNLDLFEDADLFFEKKRNSVLWLILIFIIYSFRGNAVYAMIPVLPFAVVFIVKKCRKYKNRALSLILFAMAIFIFYSGPFTAIFAKEKVSKAEMLSVPCQQLVRVYTYRNDELPEEEKKVFEEFFDSDKWYGYYVPEIADAAKGRLNVDVFDARKGDFIKLWTSWLKKYPGEYVDSFLENTYGFWYVWPKYVLYSYGQEGYTVMHPMEPVVLNSKLPALFNALCTFENGNLVMKNVFVSWLFAPATFLLVSLFAIAFMLKNKKFSIMIPVLFMALLWCTYLLGPVALVRYVLFLFIMLPVWPLYMRSSASENK